MRTYAAAFLVLPTALLFHAVDTRATSDKVVEVTNPFMERPVASETMKLVEDLRIGAGSDEEYFFARATDIAVAKDGRIFVAEQSQHMVMVFETGGDFVASFGKRGEGPGDFTMPTAMGFDNKGMLYVADQSRVSIFDQAHEFVRSFRYGVPQLVGGMAVAPDGSVFVVYFDSPSHLMIHKYNAEGKQLASFGDSYAAGKNEDVRIEQTYASGDIAIDASGSVWYSQRTPYTIQKFSGNGEPQMVVWRPNGFVKPPVVIVKGDTHEYHFGTASYSFGLMNDGTLINSIIVSMKERSEFPWPAFIDVFSKDGRLLGSVGLEPSGLFHCVDASGRLYFVEFGEQQEVVRYRLQR